MPRWLRRLVQRARAVFLGRKLDADLDEELQFHVEHLTARYRERGFPPGEAMRRARVDLDGIAGPRGEARDARGVRGVEDALHDLRLVARGLSRSPGSTITVVSTLALGLLLFASASVVEHAFLRQPLPAPDADRLYHVWYARDPGEPEPQGLQQVDWAAADDVVEMADASIFARYLVRDEAATEELVGLRIARGSLDGLGVSVIAGRSLREADFDEAVLPVLLGHRLWQERFGADTSIVGRAIVLRAAQAADQPLTFRVAGILAPRFRYVREFSRPEIDIVVPHAGRETVYMVRLRPHVPVRQAEARLTAVVRATPGVEAPASWPGVRLQSVHARYVEPVRPALRAAWIASLCVLLLVAANVTILLLLRSLRRQSEIALRLALGAGPRHVWRLLITEVALLTASATALAHAGAWWLLRAAAPSLQRTLGRVAPGGIESLSLDGATLAWIPGFAAVLTIVLTAVAVAAVRPPAAQRLREFRNVGGSRLERRARSGLMIVEVAIAIALLSGCALMVRTAASLLNADLGLRAEGVWRSRIALQAAAFPDAAAQTGFHARLVAAAAEEGVTLGLANWPLFLESARPQDVEVESAATATLRAAATATSAGYFESLSIPTIAGRPIGEEDDLAGEPVAVVSAAFAARAWPGANAVGQRLRTVDRAMAGDPVGPWRLVVGIVGNVRQMPDDEDLLDVYVPFLQAPSLYGVVVMRPSDPAAVLTPAWFRALVGRVDPRAVAGTAVTLSSEYDRTVASARWLAALLTAFGVFAAGLTLLGVYGITAHVARQRRAEVALRIVLGATARQTVALLMRHLAAVALWGSAAGVGGAWLLGRVLQSQLHHVRPFDSAMVAAIAGAVVVGAAIAAWIPARRASRVQPARLLRDA